MPAKGRIDITTKFHGIPVAGADSRGVTKIEVFCEGYVVLADVKTKTYKRFLERTQEYVNWEGSLSGTLHHIQGHQLVLTQAGLQCYEKKSK
jgi:hypothetical protein